MFSFYEGTVENVQAISTRKIFALSRSPHGKMRGFVKNPLV
jgi:hypothetical protein